MYCDECKTRPAEVHFTQVQNGKKTELHLCSQCAAKKGLTFFNFNFGEALSVPKLLGSLFGFGPAPIGQVMPVVSKKVCPNCGTSFDEIGQQGRLGCSMCYQAFQEPLESILRRIHGNSRHTGKVPQRGASRLKVQRRIEELKAALSKAIAKEEYEKAAEIRDQIKKLEKEQQMR